MWEGRNATYMSNERFSVVTEDQGEVTLEMSVRNGSGARTSPLCLPYFRGTGSGVMSDENGEWWRMRQGLYQCGGSYFNFPHNSEDVINTSNTYWTLRRYGTEEEFGGVWKYSEMKSREIGNHFLASKVDLVIPGQDVLYSAISIMNLGSEVLHGNPSWTNMLSTPLVEPKAFINTSSKSFMVYPLALRESGVNRFAPNMKFEDLKKTPLLKGGTADASIVPPATGTYDYIMGDISANEVNWVSVINPSDQMMFLTFSQKAQSEEEFSFPYCTIGQNWYGRMDAPWALFDGATPQVQSLSLGFATGSRGTNGFELLPGQRKVIYIGNAFTYLDNPRIATQGFFVNEVKPEGFLLRRTKSNFLLSADTSFKALRKISKRLFFRGLNSEEQQES